MPLPVSVATGTVTGTFLDLDGDPIEGATITFRPSPERLIVLDEPAVILPGRVIAITDPGGSIELELAATDDDSIDPTGWTWSVVIDIPRSQWSARPYGFAFELPAGATVDLTTVTPVPVAGGTAWPRPTGVVEIREGEPWPPTHESPDVLYVLTED